MNAPYRIREMAEEMDSVKEGDFVPTARWAAELRRIADWLERAGVEQIPE
jgi:hypothetical protein